MKDLFFSMVDGEDLEKCLAIIPAVIKSQISLWESNHPGEFVAFDIGQYHMMIEMKPVPGTIQNPQPHLVPWYRVVVMIVVKGKI